MAHRYIYALLVLAPCALRAQVPPPAAELEQGRRIFQAHCVSCHGPNGEGGRGATLAQPTLPRVAEAAVAVDTGRGGRRGGGGGAGGAAGRGTDGPVLTAYDRALQQIIRGGVNGTEMPSHRFQPEELRLVAQFVKSLGQMAPETVPGDPVKGAQLYQKGACATCHTLRGAGTSIGPDLTEIGRRRSAAYLRRALAEPSADVPQSFNAYRADVNMPLNFLFVRVKTRDGKDLAGVRINEDTFSIQFRDLTGKLHSFFKSELAEFHKDWGQSPMPVFAGVFTPDEMTDLVAYLSSLRGTTAR